MYRNEFKDWEGIGARVQKHRKLLGMTTERFAENIDRTENYVIRFEKGEKTCSIHTLCQFRNVLQVPTDELLFGDNMENKDYSDKQVIQAIIDRCNEKQLRVIKEVIVAMYPNFNHIIQ